MTTILVTGGAGFIGSAVIRHLINDTEFNVVNVDKLTYAGNLESLAAIMPTGNCSEVNQFFRSSCTLSQFLADVD